MKARRIWRSVCATTLLSLLAVFATAPAQADSVSEFYKGRTITFWIGVGAGGNIALYARSFSPYFEKHIPGNPKIVVQYKPGGGGRKVASYMHNVAPKDGTHIAMTLQSVPFAQKVRTKGVKYDASKWNWIGNIAQLNGVLAVLGSTQAKTLADARKSEILLAASSKGARSWLDPMLVNKFAGTKFRMVLGYRGLRNMAMAMESGEVSGITLNLLYWKINKQDWIKSGRVRFLVQFGVKPDADFPNLPLLTDIAQDAHSKRVARLAGATAAISRSIFTPQNVPTERVAALRAAFDATMKDPNFLAEAKKRRFPVTPSRGVEVQETVEEMVDMPQDVITTIQKITGIK